MKKVMCGRKIIRDVKIRTQETDKDKNKVIDDADGIIIRSVVTTATHGQRPIVFGDTAPEGPDTGDRKESEESFE